MKDSIIRIAQQLTGYLLSEGLTLDDYSRYIKSDPRTYNGYLKTLKKYIIETNDSDMGKLLDLVLIKDKDMARYKEELYREAVIEISDALSKGNDYNNGEPYGILDFYMSKYRNLNLATLSSKATQYLNPEDKRRLSIFVGQERRPMGYVTVVYTDKYLYDSAKEIFIDGEKVEIPDDIREKALEIFKEYNIPNNLITYKQLCTRLYKGIFKKSR